MRAASPHARTVLDGRHLLNLGQVSLQHAEHVRNYQTGRFLQRFLGNNDADPFETKIAFHDDPDKRVEQFNITVNSDLSHWGFESSRVKTATAMEDIRQEIIANKIPYEEQLEGERNYACRSL